MNGLPDGAADALVVARVVVAGADELEDAGAEGLEDVAAAAVDDSVVLGAELLADVLDLDDPPPQPVSVRAARDKTVVTRGIVAIFTT